MTRIKTLLLTAFAMSVVAAPALASGLAPADLLSGDLASPELARPASVSIAPLADREPSAKTEGVMSSDDLSEESGAANTISQAITDQKLLAQNSDNVVAAGNDVIFGDVTIGDGAFTGFNGIGVINVNTGANSNLQGSIGVSIVPN